MQDPKLIKLSDNFTLYEALRSDKAKELGVDNSPDPGDLDTLKRTAEKMEIVRSIFGDKPIIVTSWYRNSVVNKAVGGVPNSQHKLGEAVDFIVQGVDNYRAIHMLRQKTLLLQYDQLIWEPTWIHISFLTSGQGRDKPRMQYLDKRK